MYYQPPPPNPYYPPAPSAPPPPPAWYPGYGAPPPPSYPPPGYPPAHGYDAQPYGAPYAPAYQHQQQHGYNNYSGYGPGHNEHEYGGHYDGYGYEEEEEAPDIPVPKKKLVVHQKKTRWYKRNWPNPYADKILEALVPMQRFLQVLGRFCMTWKKWKKGTYVFAYSWKSPFGVYFIFTSCLCAYVATVAALSVAQCGVGLNFQIDPEKRNKTQILIRYEHFVLSRHVTTFLFTWGTMVESAVGTYAMLCRYKYICKYYHYWTK